SVTDLQAVETGLPLRPSRLCGLMGLCSIAWLRFRLRIRLPQRQDEGEGAALVHDGVHGEAGFHLFGQLIDHGEAQPGAATDGEGFGGEEGLEDAGQIVRRYAGAEVLDGKGRV